MESAKVQLHFTPEISAVRKDESRELIVMVSVKAPLYQAEKRATIDVVSVIDRSGSMAGERLRLVKDAMGFVIQNLTDQDRLGIITYDDTVVEQLTFHKMDEKGKELAKSAVSKIYTGGSTNLCGGMLRGIKQVQSLQGKGNKVASVLLFTDGQANVGYTQANDIIRAMYDSKFAANNSTAGGWRNSNSRIQYPVQPQPMIPLVGQPQLLVQPQVQQVQLPLAGPPQVQPNPYMPSQQVPYQLQQQVPYQLQQQVPYQLQQQQQVPYMQVQQLQQQVPYMQAPQMQQQVPFYVTPAPTPTPQPIFAPAPEKWEREPLPCTVNTFGFGADHEAELLKKISEEGNGMYYYIQTKDVIAEAFADCLGGLLSVAGQNLDITIESVGGVKINTIYTRFKKETLQEGSSYKLSLPDIQSEEQKDILLSIQIPTEDFAMQEAPLLKVTLNYFNCISSTNDTSEFNATLSRPMEAAPETRNSVLDCQLNRVLAATAMEEADALAKENRLEQARQKLSSTISRISESVSASEEFSQGLIADLKKCLGGLASSQSWAAAGSKMLQGQAQAQMQQRSNASPSMGWAGQGAYQNTARCQMQQQQQIYQQQQPPPGY